MAKPQYNGPWPKLRLAILQRDRYVCQIRSPVCTKRATEADHIRKIRDGGAWWDMANLRASCRKCNRGWNRHTPKPARNW